MKIHKRKYQRNLMSNLTVCGDWIWLTQTQKRLKIAWPWKDVTCKNCLKLKLIPPNP